MEVDAHIAFLKKKIDETAYRALLAVLALPADATSSASVKLDGKPIYHSSLSILDTVIDGVVVFSADSLLLHPAQRLIAYIPNDSGAPFFEFSSLQVFTDELKHRLRDPAYAEFFTLCRLEGPRRVYAKRSMPIPRRAVPDGGATEDECCAVFDHGSTQKHVWRCASAGGANERVGRARA